jgi:hypothetical protein
MRPFLKHVNHNSVASLEVLMDGSAHKPFVFRQLIPKTILVIDALVPKRLSTLIEAQLFSHKTTAWIFGEVRVPQELAFEASLALIIDFLSLVVYAAFLFSLGKSLFPASPRLPVVAVLIGLAAIPPNVEYAYFYDFPVLALSAAVLYYLAEARFFPYIVAYSLACVNKETSVLFVVLFFFVARARLSRKRFWLLLGGQVLFFALLRLAQSIAYRANAGSSMHLHWRSHIEHLGDYSLEGFAAFLFFATLICASFPDKPTILKRGLWLLLPFEVLFLIGGNPGEYRVFYELHPVLVLLAAHGLFSLVRPASGIPPRMSPDHASGGQ